MKIAAMRKFDIANGPGIRATMFVSGCTHNCKGCFNQEYRNFEYGRQFNMTICDEFIEYVKNPNIKGVTILGGEPFDQDTDLLFLVKRIKMETGKPIWIFSGYTYDVLITRPLCKDILMHCDVLVDGPFVESLKDYRLKFRGSSNQRIIDIRQTMLSNDVVLYNI